MYSVEWTSNCLVFSYFVFLFFLFENSSTPSISSIDQFQKKFFLFSVFFRLSGGGGEAKGV